MKIKTILAIVTLLTAIPMQVLAGEEQEKSYLIQMVNQLDAVKPLLIAAAKQQPKNSRVQFHYMAYRDTNGKLHNGLLEDINEIKKGIQSRLNQEGNEPHHFQAIKGDYINTEILHVNG